MRAPWAIRALSAVFVAYLRLTYATMRWTRVGQEEVEALWREGGSIACFWHAGIPLGPGAWPEAVERGRIQALISNSKDGEFIAQVIARIGFSAIRGSSAKRTDPSKNKGGEQAFREMLRWVRRGGVMAITPDGPRGPARVMDKGAVVLAQVAGAPVLMAGLACRPCLRLGTWDGTVIPLPFARAALTWDGPLHAPRDADAEALAADWAARLTAVTQRAEALVAGGG